MLTTDLSLAQAVLALGVVFFLVVFVLVLGGDEERRLDRDVPCTLDQVVGLQKPQSVVEPLHAHLCQHLCQHYNYVIPLGSIMLSY